LIPSLLENLAEECSLAEIILDNNVENRAEDLVDVIPDNSVEKNQCILTLAHETISLLSGTRLGRKRFDIGSNSSSPSDLPNNFLAEQLSQQWLSH
jgi:hypothetical protein